MSEVKLTRAIYAMTSVAAIAYATMSYEGKIWARAYNAKDFNGVAHLGERILMTEVLGYIGLLLCASLLLLRIRSFFHGWFGVGTEKRPVFAKILKSLLAGIGCGLVVSLLTSPLPKGREMEEVARLATFMSGNDTAYFLFPSLILLTVLLSLSTEIFFRRIVFISFLEHSSLLASLIVSSMCGAYLCPAVGMFQGILLGTVCCLLYYRTRDLMACMLTDVVYLWTGVSASGVFHHFYRGI